MAVKFLASCWFAGSVSLAVAGSGSHHGQASAVDAMYQAEVQRMELAHEKSVAALEQNMTMRSAFAHLQKNPKATPELLQLVQEINPAVRGSSQKQTFLGFAQKTDPTGYGGLDKARNLLNEMLNEVNAKHDEETQRCKSFFSTQCALMETVRQDIAAANAAASDARSRILASQTQINYCEVQLPRLRHELWESERVCSARIADLEASLKIVLADIEVMVSVLKMTDCDAAPSTSLVQVTDLRMMRCNCSGQTVVSMHHGQLRNSLSQIKEKELRKTLTGTLKALLDDMPTDDGFETLSNVTNFTNPPLPKTEVPANPCKGLGFRRKPVGDKCSLSSNPMCYKLQDKFLAIQAGIEDTRDKLMMDLDETKTRCRITKETLEGEISALETTFQDQQTKLATATSEENKAGEQGRVKGEEHHNLASTMFETRETCSNNLETFESEQCALKKIRGELYKVKGDSHPAFFQDCEVSDWKAAECLKDGVVVTCGGGTETLERSITVQPFKGTDCPPLLAAQGCSMEECPVDCEVADWSGWSSCSADCNGGVQQRTRAVVTQPKNGGEPCGDTSESVSCNVQACDADCVLHDWSTWSNCSKACSGGITFRKRDVETPEVGGGTCPAEECPDTTAAAPGGVLQCERHEEKFCNMAPCPKTDPDLPLHCDAKVDVVLLLDGSGSIGQDGFDAEKAFADIFVSAFESVSAQFSIIVYSGPKTWSAYSACFDDPNVDMVNTCGINKVQDFSDDLEATRATIKGLEWPSGTTFTSVALKTAATELSLSRPDAPAVVVLVTDGAPLSALKTADAAKTVRDAGSRLMIVPVQGRGLTDASRDWMMTLASEPKEDNFIPLEDIAMFSEVGSVDKLVASACPSIDTNLVFEDKLVNPTV